MFCRRRVLEEEVEKGSVGNQSVQLPCWEHVHGCPHFLGFFPSSFSLVITQACPHRTAHFINAPYGLQQDEKGFHRSRGSLAKRSHFSRLVSFERYVIEVPLG